MGATAKKMKSVFRKEVRPVYGVVNVKARRRKASANSVANSFIEIIFVFNENKT